MNPVIQRLALRAHPDPGGVRPRIASRFEWSTPAPLPFSNEEDSTASGPIDQVPGKIVKPPAPDVSGPIPAPHFDATDEPPAAPPPRTAAKAVTASPIADITPPKGADLAITEEAPAHVIEVAARHHDDPRRSPPQQPNPTISAADAPRSALLLPDLAAPVEPAFAFRASAAPDVPPSRVEPALPDIHVTIGRIDITAESEQRAPPRPVSPPRPKLMSLEDYLAKSRGRR